MRFEKHPLNILPDMNNDERQELRENIEKNGFDKNFPIFTFEGKILDGWNRYLICEELEVEPYFIAKDEEFAGDSEKAVDFVRQVNTRRNLTSSQKAALAVECRELIEKIKNETEKKRREKQSATQKSKKTKAGVETAGDEEPEENREKTNESTISEGDGEGDGDNSDEMPESAGEESSDGDDLSSEETGISGTEETGETDDVDDAEDVEDEHQNKSATKLAEKFGTNRTYVHDAARLKESNPDEFEKVKSGEKSLSQAKRDSSVKTRTFFEEIAARFSEFGRVLKKLQDYGDSELDQNLHDLYPEIMKTDIKDFEKKNGEIAKYILCEECGGTGCEECGERGFTKPSKK